MGRQDFRLLVFGTLASCCISLATPHQPPIRNGMSPERADVDEITAWLIPHTHCDVGWLETWESAYNLNVSQIIPGVIENLSRDRSKRFVWAEQAFFKKWWDEDSTEAQRDLVADLVQTGQLEMVDGGITQHDQALPTARQIAVNMETGLRFLWEALHARPRVGWSLDPFGSSAANALLYSLMGYDALVINRVPQPLLDEMKTKKSLEFTWQPSPDLTNNTMFTKCLDSYYCSPTGFRWSWSQGDSDPITPENVHQRADDFIKQVLPRKNWFAHSHILVPWGCDYTFQNASETFEYTDLLIANINANASAGLTVRYGTPSEYFTAIGVFSGADSPSVASGDWPFKGPGSDFFPYFTNESEVWSGFYSSRPNVKRSSRSATTALHSASAFLALGLASVPHSVTESGPLLDVLESAEFDNAISLHHDAITGTCCQAREGCTGGGQTAGAHDVCDDYIQTQIRSETGSSLILTGALAALSIANTSLALSLPALAHHSTCGSQVPLFVSVDSRIFQNNLERRRLTAVVVTNALGWKDSVHVAVDVPISCVSVSDANGVEIPSQMVDRAAPAGRFDSGYLSTKFAFTLHFTISLPPLASTTVFLHPGTFKTVQGACGPPAHHLAPDPTIPPDYGGDGVVPGDGTFVFGSDHLELHGNNVTGVVALYEKASQTNSTLSLELYEIQSDPCDQAYVWCPSNHSFTRIPLSPHSTIATVGPLLSRAYMEFSQQHSATVRLARDAGYVDLDIHVGTLAVNTSLVLVLRAPGLGDNPTLETDGAGIQDIVRQFGMYGNSTAQNTFPSQASTSMRGEGLRLWIAMGHSHAAVHWEGGLAIVLGRRNRAQASSVVLDDKDGSLHQLRFSVGQDRLTNVFRHTAIHRFGASPVLVASREPSQAEDWYSSHSLHPSPSLLTQPLPPSLHLFSLAPYSDNVNGTVDLSLRLEHSYSGSEEPVELARPQTVVFTHLFSSRHIIALRETTFGLNRVISRLDPDSGVTLLPKQIRSFIITFTATK